MTAPNMASLERSLQSFSLNHRSTTTTTATSTVSPMTRCNYSSSKSSDATLELNSNITLPYHWEQCLDLKTGEMYYINWRTGMKSKEDPRMVDEGFTGYFYSDDDDADDEDDPEDDGSSYTDSEEGSGSSVESSPAASSSRKLRQNKDKDEDKDEDENESESCISGQNTTNVLVVAGCKGCFMYFMVPKQVEDCPKCCGQLLHFDRSDDN